MSKILIVVAHPDDELLTFAPVLLYHLRVGDSVHVMCMTEDNLERSASFFKVAKELEFTPYVFGVPDSQANEKLFTNQNISALTAYIQKHGFDRIYTHDPFSGDQGRHQHHIETAIVTGLASLNCNLLEKTRFLMTEGYAGTNYPFSLTKDEYARAVRVLDMHYSKDLQYLLGEGETAYHIASFAVTAQLDIEGFIKYSVGYIASWRKDWSVSRIMPGVDLYNTHDAQYEIRKREAIINSIQQNFKLPLSPRVLLDIGTGKGHTTKLFFNLAINKYSSKYILDPNYEATDIDRDVYLDSYDNLPEKKYDIPIVSSFFCSIPWIDLEDFIKVLDISDAIALDSYLEDDFMEAVKERFPYVEFDNFQVTGLRDKTFANVTPIYSECIYMMYAYKEDPNVVRGKSS